MEGPRAAGRSGGRQLLQKLAGLLLILSLAAWLVWAALQGQPWHRSLLQPLSEEAAEFVYDPRLKYVLIWRSFFDEVNLGFSHRRGADLFSHCPQNACYMTAERDVMAAEKYDAVVLHTNRFKLASLPDGNKLPPRRRPEQVYIFFLLESPVNSGIDFRYMKDLFNWTMTYRLDSDIVLPYGEMRELEGKTRVETWLRPPHPPPSPAEAEVIMRNATARRTKSEKGGARVAWLVSHCHTQSRREDLVAQLQKYVTVDIFGDCGRHWPKDGPALMRFYSALADDYHFYLSFENSLCRDYVTEKLYFVMPLHVVPIVYGGANYSAVVPPSSYIDVRDFPSPEHLGRYLQFLVSHPEEYEKFFWWKEYYRVEKYPPSVICTLCSMLHSQLPPKSYPDMEQWWDKAAHCQLPNLILNSSWLN